MGSPSPGDHKPGSIHLNQQQKLKRREIGRNDLREQKARTTALPGPLARKGCLLKHFYERKPSCPPGMRCGVVATGREKAATYTPIPRTRTRTRSKEHPLLLFRIGRRRERKNIHNIIKLAT